MIRLDRKDLIDMGNGASPLFLRASFRYLQVEGQRYLRQRLHRKITCATCRFGRVGMAGHNFSSIFAGEIGW